MKNVLKFNKYNKLNENINDLFFTTPLIDVMDEYFIAGSEFAKRNNLPLEDKSNFDISESEFTVNWELDVDARNWGIKHIGIVIKKIHGTFTVNIWGDDEDVPHYVDFNAEEWGFEIKTELEMKDTIVPSAIEINFKDKTVTIK